MRAVHFSSPAEVIVVLRDPFARLRSPQRVLLLACLLVTGVWLVGVVRAHPVATGCVVLAHVAGLCVGRVTWRAVLSAAVAVWTIGGTVLALTTGMPPSPILRGAVIAALWAGAALYVRAVLCEPRIGQAPAPAQGPIARVDITRIDTAHAARAPRALEGAKLLSRVSDMSGTMTHSATISTDGGAR